MDLEVVGRHAMLFDDDPMAAFVNSAEALVEWYSLSIDRYDVRHLLPGPLPPRLKRRPTHHSSLEADIDSERYLDLPSPYSPQHQPQDNGLDPVSSDGYRAVAFSYENPTESTASKDNDTDSGFLPPFPVPGNLLHNLPPNEKVHQIISRTAMFVSKNGSQSEIVLRVKQGDNPTFGFLMPDHHLHAYFRFLVDNQELLKADKDDGNSSVDKNRSQGLDQTGGALSLLGSVYGSGEDEDGTTENTYNCERNECKGVVDAVTYASPETQQADSSSDAVKKDGNISKYSVSSLKEKVPVIKRNHSIGTVKMATAAKAKTDSLSNAAEKSHISAPSTAKIELPVVEPASDLKRVIEKIVEFIVRNGKQLEAVLAEQDRAHGRFPFLLPSNRYHTYYLKVLQTAEESKLPGKGIQKHNPAGRASNNNTSVHKESDNVSCGSMGSDLPHDMDRKEKFKMIIGKSKNDGQDPTPKDSQSQNTVTMDATAAAAILQAATRGIKHPNVEWLTKTSSGDCHGLGSDGGYLTSSGSLYSSSLKGFVEISKLNAEASASVPVAKAIAETVAMAAAGEADSSEAHMTKEQKLKAERLKRAKMFAAMIKNGAPPFKSEMPRGLSVEPPGSELSGSDAGIGSFVAKEREGSSVPFEVYNSDKSQKSEEKLSTDNSDKSHKSEDKVNEPRSKRSYRSRSRRHESEEEDKEESDEDNRDHKRSRKKHRSHRSSHSSWDRHKHKRRRSSSKDKFSSKGIKDDSSSDDEHHHSRHHHKYDSSSDAKCHSSGRRHRHKHYSSSDDEHRHRSRDNEHRHSQHRHHKHYSSSDDEHRHRIRNVKHKSRSHAERETDLEEGEIIMKSEKSKTSEVGRACREASVGLSKSDQLAKAPSQSPETTEVSDELRAKIRAMLMANI